MGRGDFVILMDLRDWVDVELIWGFCLSNSWCNLGVGGLKWSKLVLDISCYDILLVLVNCVVNVFDVIVKDV